jgi:hypothetical protein
MAVTAGVYSSSHRGTEPSLKKDRYRGPLRVFFQYMWGAACSLHGSLAPPMFVPELKEVIFGW